MAFNLSNVGEIFLVESERIVSKFRKTENFCVVLNYSIKRPSEIRKFHVAVVQQRLRNEQIIVMHLQSCSFANLNLLLFLLLKNSLYCCLPEILLP